MWNPHDSWPTVLSNEVEKHPILYNHTLPGYINREEQEEEWQRVALTLHESVHNIKQKWASLRGSLCRHIRQLKFNSPGYARRPYYMAQHMAYLIPFTRVRGPNSKAGGDEPDSGAAETSSSLDLDEDKLRRQAAGMGEPEDFLLEVKPEIEECNEYDEDMRSNEDDFATHFLATSETPPSCKRPKLTAHTVRPEVSSLVQTVTASEDTCSSQGWFPEAESSMPVKTPCVGPREDHNSSVQVVAAAIQDRNDPEMNFLKSLLPDMKKMTDSQKNKFKISVLQLIQQTLYETWSFLFVYNAFYC